MEEIAIHGWCACSSFSKIYDSYSEFWFVCIPLVQCLVAHHVQSILDLAKVSFPEDPVKSVVQKVMNDHKGSRVLLQ